MYYTVSDLAVECVGAVVCLIWLSIVSVLYLVWLSIVSVLYSKYFRIVNDNQKCRP